MPDKYRPSEQALRMYRDVTSQIGPDFGHRVASVISTRIEPPADLVLLGLLDNEDRFPNDYVTFLEAALNGMRYRPSVIRGVPLNGNLLPKEITEELVKGKPAVVVEVHPSPYSELYLVELKLKGASQRFYTFPPAMTWELSDADEFVQLRERA